ncbi:MAG: type II toxin-antitoxin system YafQ family toxin [Lachnospiraceae bacterium]|nr:type II toxin-antitoxin system YafQ family toxin [Lachnospiraceae bacterium]
MKKTKYTVKFTTSFKKDYKRAIKRGLKIELLDQVVAFLAMGEPLPDKNRDHDLSGDWAGHRECHILPDWLLIYRRMRKPIRRFFSMQKDVLKQKML